MDIDAFLFKDRQNEIQRSFIKNGWITVYESKYDNHDSALVFACLVYRTYLKKFMETRDWGIHPSREGKPCVIGAFQNDTYVSKYHAFSDEGFEPLIFSKYFSHNDERYIDISEDFINYYKLYEKVDSKQEREYFFIDDMGELEPVVSVKPQKVKIKWKFLLEFISMREMCVSVGFDFMNSQYGEATEIESYLRDENTITDTSNFNHLIRNWIGGINDPKLQSWIHGKTVLLNDPAKAVSYLDWLNAEKYESFITGYDNNGDLVYTNCNGENLGIILTFFKKDVLEKYYNNSHQYEVDSFGISCDYFSLKIDNSVLEYVPVFVHYLKSLPHKEQLHWKYYNIEPKEGMGMSRRYYEVMIEGNWSTEPSTPDFFFKEYYKEFNEKWLTKFGWPFYKELTGLDSYQFKSLHIPTNNNIKSFCEQIMALIKITIDGINEKEIIRDIRLDEHDKGLTKFEKYLKHHNVEIPDMMLFLRNLQALRSGLIAHRFSSSHKTTKKAIEYFKITQDSYQEIACDIFTKSVYTLRALEKIFLN